MRQLACSEEDKNRGPTVVTITAGAIANRSTCTRTLSQRERRLRKTKQQKRREGLHPSRLGEDFSHTGHDASDLPHTEALANVLTECIIHARAAVIGRYARPLRLVWLVCEQANRSFPEMTTCLGVLLVLAQLCRAVQSCRRSRRTAASMRVWQDTLSWARRRPCSSW